ncbi:hypothetical protein BDN72DRAFT_488637 [Pluteus cervinus]|uniref:Uncharacterized protein n=1 Tax=Pluteus cervinus TaxID=181527 RepID=A0ACD3A571_9AGAR|nr:hypothetical protein BDN72DRAFT_488637 [Pluteus cervinus]
MTGRYDYLFLTLPQDPRDPELKLPDEWMKDFLQQTSFAGLRTKLNLLTYQLGYIVVFVLEAKRLMSGPLLLNQLPQVIAQSRVGMTLIEKAKGQSASAGRGISFCLSTGKIWIFGLLHQPQGDANKTLFQVYHTGTLECDPEKPETVKEVFKTLAVWVS